MSATYSTRDEAIQREIVDPIEASANVAAEWPECETTEVLRRRDVVRAVAAGIATVTITAVTVFSVWPVIRFIAAVSGTI